MRISMIFFEKPLYLPATIICRNPFIFITFFEDFINWRDSFEKWFLKNPKTKAYALFKLGFEYESKERVEYARKNIEMAKLKFPQLETVFLCNSDGELSNFSSLGAKAVLCNQNCFLDERRYKALDCEKTFDAVYLARITPFKRHYLVEGLPKILYIGAYTQKEKAFAEDVISKFSPSSKWVKKVLGIFVYKFMAKAKVGLALSEAEGAMYAAGEYGLCGLPVVTTRNLGGRNYSLDPKYTFEVDSDNPVREDVRSLIDKAINMNFPPREVRAATIAVFEKYRTAYRDLLDSIFVENGLGRAPDSVKKIFHKMGLRARVALWRKFFIGMKL